MPATATTTPSATLLLVTGLLSVGMASIGLYYLQMKSKTVLLKNEKNAGMYTKKYHSKMTTTTRTATKNLATRVKATEPTQPEVLKKETNNVKAATSKAEKLPINPIELKEPTMLKEDVVGSTTIAKDAFQSVVPSVKLSVTTDPVTPLLVAKEVETLSGETLELPVIPIIVKEPRLSKENLVTVKEMSEDLIEPIENPAKGWRAERTAAPASEVLDVTPVTLERSDDFGNTQTVVANEPTDNALIESLEQRALEHEFVQVELTQSMTLPQRDCELENTNVATVTTIADNKVLKVEPFDATEDLQMEPIVAIDAVASATGPYAHLSSWEAIGFSSDETFAIANETAPPASLDTSNESTEPLDSLVTDAVTENTVALDKDASSPVDRNDFLLGNRNRHRNRSKKSKNKKKKSKKLLKQP
ncbi:hypothetical protein CCR75_004728 [Bremia lactucae]|uniref:Uncharacterized protein n=1 Tax=Bremia lactucae TaxID=4779 RepID=A0A976NYX7_BRELC|nr:hypothetical protein CCR75_004728 [Bremia lactucae]